MAHKFRPFAWVRWLVAGETLAQAPPDSPAATQPGPGLRRFFFGPDSLPDATDAPPPGPSSAARAPFWRWLLTPERLPQTGTAKPPRAES